MPTYYIRLPEDAEKKALISNLVGTLEKLNGIVVFDAIGVVLPLGAPEAELMRSLAGDIVPDRELIFHPNVDHPSVAEKDLFSKITRKERTCPHCGVVFFPAGNRQMFCSKTCRIKMSTNDNGSGLKQGKLVGHAS